MYYLHLLFIVLILFYLTFLLGLFGYKDYVLYYKVDCKNIFILPYLCGYTIYCEKKIDYPLYGIWVFCGSQGSGKTLSMVRQAYIINQKYSNVTMRSNFNLPFTQYIRNLEEVFPLKRSCICIDELGIVANSKKSKEENTLLLKCTAQNRKNRRLILTTAQQYYQINKDVRTQASYIIDVSCLFKRLFINRYYIPIVDNEGNIKHSLPSKIDFFVATDKLFELYDTMEVIQ